MALGWLFSVHFADPSVVVGKQWPKSQGVMAHKILLFYIQILTLKDEVQTEINLHEMQLAVNSTGCSLNVVFFAHLLIYWVFIKYCVFS